MKFIENVSKDKYETFVQNHPKSHFLQSYNWGQFAKKEKHLFPHYVGLEDKQGNLVAATLLLQKKLPFNYCYFYAPRGYVLDYQNSKVLKEFTEKTKQYAKTKKAIFVKIDPDTIYHEEDNQGNTIVKENMKLINDLKLLGYKHLGFTKNFETMQPRYTFRISLDQNWETIENNFSKTTKQRIKKAEDFLIDVKIGNKKDINTFYKLMILTENRKDFVTHNEQYYKSLYEIWNHDDNKCNLFLGSVDLNKIITTQETIKSELEENIKKLPKENLSKSEKSKKNEWEKRIKKLDGDLTRYYDIKKNFPNKITLSAHFILEYGDKAWVLYAGNHNILTETYANYKTYEEHIHYYQQKGIKIYDQFGTIGDLRPENPLLGLHEFKKKFGGNYVEFTGEFDLVLNKLMYFIFTKLVPFYRKAIKLFAKKKNNKKKL